MTISRDSQHDRTGDKKKGMLRSSPPPNRKASPAGFSQRLSRGYRWIGGGRLAALVLLALLLVLRWFDPAPLQTLRLQTFDLYQVLQPREARSDAIAVVDLDEESLAEIGQWPWPRTTVARLVDELTAKGAVAIAFDVLFAEPDRMSPGHYAESISGVDESVRAQLRALPNNDEVFADSLGQSLVVLGNSFYKKESRKGAPPLEQIPFATLGKDPRPYLFKYPGVVQNIDTLGRAAAGQALFSLVPDRDGLVRRVPGLILAGDVIVPTLTLELLRLATGGNAYAVKTDDAGVKSIVVGGIEIPTDRNGRLWVHYAKRESDNLIAAKDVLSGVLPPEQVAGKLVLVGTSAAGLFDVKSTPLHSFMPGVEIHAQLLDTILTQSHLTRPHTALAAEMFLMVAIGLLIIVAVPALGAQRALILGAILAAGMALLSWFLYAGQALLIDVAFPLIGGLVIYIYLVFHNYFDEENRRRQVRHAFRQYLAPALVDQLAENPDRLVLGGETRTMSFLFCDVRGFTAISEGFREDPQGLTRFMNRFLTPLSDAILANDGTIDKYMGDGIMAFWNAPLDDPDHAAHACQTALQMLDALADLNRDLAAEGSEGNRAPLRVDIRVGINSGTCVVGNLGSDLHFDYSVLGDAVNVASRLEGQAEYYGVDVLIGGATAEAVGQQFALLELDRLQVVGKSAPETVYGLLGDATLAQSLAFQKLLHLNREMLAAYRDRDWAKAREKVAQIEALPDLFDIAGFCNLYRERIEDMETTPPPSDWAGIHVAGQK